MVPHGVDNSIYMQNKEITENEAIINFEVILLLTNCYYIQTVIAKDALES